MPRPILALTAAALAAALAVPLLPTSGSAYAAAPTCEGLPATIVGDGPGLLLGTPGDDVIVTNGATSTSADAGDDHVCVTTSSDVRAVSVAAAAGDDVVTGAGVQVVNVTLGTGDDVFRGGPEVDRVGDMTLPGTGSSDPTFSGDDVVITGPGDDEVSVGQYVGDGRGRPGEAVADRVALGTGDDRLIVQSRVAPGFTAVGGGGRDAFGGWSESRSEASGGVTWRFDTTTGRITGAASSWVWSSFEVVGLSMDHASFRGSEADEDVFIEYAPPLALLGAGDDVLQLGGPPSPGDLLLGGPGRDRFRDWEFLDEATVDLRRGEIRDDRARWSPIPFRGFEPIELIAGDRLTLLGTNGPDEMYGAACQVRARGLRGDDVIAAVDGGPDLRCVIRARLEGGRGDDRLWGSQGRDVAGSVRFAGNDRLVGGPGSDRADGRGGRDLCRAEVRRHCERR